MVSWCPVGYHEYFIHSFVVFASTLADRPPSLLSFPIDGRGQPLFSPVSTSSHTDQALGLFSHALGSASTGFVYTRFSFVTLDPWGASPFLFFPALSPVFSIFSSSISCPRVSSYSFPPPPIPAYTSCATSLSSSSPSSSRTMFCAMSFLN